MRSYRVAGGMLTTADMVAVEPMGAPTTPHAIPCQAAPFVIVCDNARSVLTYRYDERGRFSGPVSFPAFQGPFPQTYALATFR